LFEIELSHENENEDERDENEDERDENEDERDENEDENEIENEIEIENVKIKMIQMLQLKMLMKLFSN
jgi:TATA-binding protein-associated factor Taf7